MLARHLAWHASGPSSNPEVSASLSWQKPLQCFLKGGSTYVQYSAAQRSAAQCSAVQRSAAQCSAAQCNNVRKQSKRRFRCFLLPAYYSPRSPPLRARLSALLVLFCCLSMFVTRTAHIQFTDLSGEVPIKFQNIILKTQMHLEDSTKALAESLGKPAVILCDRGCMDGSAYVRSKPPLATENLLENTDGGGGRKGGQPVVVLSGRQPATFLFMLTCALF